MESTEAAAPRRRPRPTPRRVVVRAVHTLSPRMRRITLGGDELATFVWSGPAAHCKLIFPLPGTERVPDYDPDGPRPATIRTYTPRRFDAAAHELDVDFVLHGEGPASTWAAAARPGQELILLGPARGYEIDPELAWFVAAVDDAALPALETLLEALPTSVAVTAFVEVDAADERRPLPGNARVEWLVRDPARAHGAALLDALTAFAWPTGAGRVYVGCEAEAMRRIRPLVVAASGLDKERIVTRGYWRSGEQNHPDHDYARD